MAGLCNAAWNSITFLPNGKILPCCQFDYSQGLDVKEFRGVDTFKDVQNTMLAGHTPSGCDLCFPEYQAKFGTDPADRTAIQFLDLRNTNFCNYACRFCGPEASSKIDQLINGGPHIAIRTNVEPMLPTVVNPQLKEIYFTGGEPLLNLDHWLVLDQIIKQGTANNVVLRYNSNLSTLKYRHRHVQDYWPEFQQVELRVSLDAVGRELEMIRTGANWKIIDRNLRELISKCVPNLNIIVACTVSSLNVWFLEPLVQYCAELNIQLQMDLLIDPDTLSINHLPDEFKHQAHQILVNLNQHNLAQQIDLGLTEDYFALFIAHVMLLDRINGENLYDLLPFDRYARKILLKY